MKILGICGSLREKSINKGLLKAAIEVAPEGIKVDTFDIGTLPLFNQDFENTPPKEVSDFKKKIEEADAILFVTPEYNYSISGVLKNAIDWASRPYGNNSWNEKPAAIMGASGPRGTVRAQLHLRQMFVTMNVFAFNKPEMLVDSTGKFDENGNLTDEETKKRIGELLEALASWTKKLQA
jgi:chromate reductase